MMFVCTTKDTEPKPNDEKIEDILKSHGELREEIVTGLWGLNKLANRLTGSKIRENDCLLHYGQKVWSRKRKTPVDVAQLVTEWTEVVVALSTAHDKAEIDKAEFKMDELLTPLLTAPVPQLREFHKTLTEALRKDKRVPFFMWSMFNGWSKGILEKCETATEMKELRHKLASEIATMVDADIKPDITEAVTNALMWRDPETLEKIKGDLNAGAKPRLRGKESCLFLVTQSPATGEEHTVML